MKGPQYWSEELARLKAKQVDSADLERQAREYAKVRTGLHGLCATHGDMFTMRRHVAACSLFLHIYQEQAERLGLNFDEILKHGQEMNALEPTTVIKRTVPDAGGFLKAVWACLGLALTCIGMDDSCCISLDNTCHLLLCLHSGRGAAASRLGHDARPNHTEALLLAQEDTEDNVGTTDSRYAH